MSSVTFDVAVGGDGSTVTDDNNATTGLREGGWKTRFVPCFTQQVAVANYIVTKAGEASTSASAASASASAAAASYDSFDDRYLGSKTSDPSVDNDGNALITGAIYWNSSSSVMKVWSGSAWVSYNPAISYLPLSGGTMTGNIVFASGQIISGYLPTTGGTMTGAITFASGQTIANLASGSAGTIPYQSASGTTAMLSAGTSGQVLTSGGAGAPTWSALPTSGLTLGTPVASTSGSSIDFTGLPSGVKQITVTFSRVSVDTTATMVIRLGGSGSFAISGYNTGALKWISNVGTYTPATDGFLISSISSATQLSGTYIFTLENSSTNKWSGQGIFTTGDISPPTILMCAGESAIDSTLTKIRVTTSGSTFDGGEINIAYQ